MESYCSNCKQALDDRPHRRTTLCDYCYQEKRRGDINKNVNKLRDKVKAAKPRKIEDEFLFIAMRNFKYLGYTVSDWEWDNLETNSGFIELAGTQKFDSTPTKPHFCEWEITYTNAGNTRINYYFSEWHSSPMWLESNHGRCRYAMNNDLERWQVELVRQKLPEYRNINYCEILKIIREWALENFVMAPRKTRNSSIYIATTPQ